MIGRGGLSLSAALGFLGSGLAAQAAQLPLAAIAWAGLVGVGLSLILQSTALRLMSVLLSISALSTLIWAVSLSAWLIVGFSVLSAAAALWLLWRAPAWVRRTAQEHDQDPARMWKLLDEGEDPTAQIR